MFVICTGTEIYAGNDCSHGSHRTISRVGDALALRRPFAGISRRESSGSMILVIKIIQDL